MNQFCIKTSKRLEIGRVAKWLASGAQKPKVAGILFVCFILCRLDNLQSIEYTIAINKRGKFYQLLI